TSSSADSSSANTSITEATRRGFSHGKYARDSVVGQRHLGQRQAQHPVRPTENRSVGAGGYSVDSIGLPVRRRSAGGADTRQVGHNVEHLRAHTTRQSSSATNFLPDL